MQYEHTPAAIASLLLGIFLIVDCFLVLIAGPQWLPLNEGVTLWATLIHFVVYFGFFFGPALIALGVVGIRRELWVRRFEHRARS